MAMTMPVVGGLLFAMAALVAGDYASSRVLVCLGLVLMACSLLVATRALGQAKAQSLQGRSGLQGRR
jgi:C4-dicarboxylate transporter